MKKVIVIAVLVGMFGYAIFDLLKDGKEKNLSTIENETSDAKIGIEVDNIAPDFQLETLDGETVKLSDYRGQRVMLNFWATWCPPCRAEMPDMEAFYQANDVAIVAVNLTETEANLTDVNDFKEDFNLSFPIFLDEKNEVATTYQIRPIPSSYMIDSKGIIRYKALGALNYEMMVAEFEKMQ
ncbi:peroxiredoxin family protein [Paraliobacillus sediminis]|uniref:peroxiredoxin family protein n=1 Tax=Paraliobacillus sediminis TaxID=1885916 RepID=UPI000E3E6AC9|nr:TlpA disulfide reductase family protein [Paraliobacillus sediminis]